MLPLGLPIYVDFRVVDISSVPVTGLGITDFAVTFRRNDLPCTDALTFHNYGDGTYTVSYTPSAAGHDYLALYNAANDIRALNVEDVVTQASIIGGSDVTQVDQNYTGAGNLQVTQPDPQTWVLLMFLSSDWDLGNRADANAVGITTVDTLGDWINPITVSLGRYHIVVRRASTVVIMKAYFEIPQ